MFDKQILTLPGASCALALCLVCSFAIALLIVGQALSLSYAIVRIWQGEAFASQLPAMGAFAVCFVARALVRTSLDSRMQRYAHSCVCGIRHDVAMRLYDTGSAMISEFGTADIVTSLIDGSQKTETYIRKTLPKTVQLIVIPLVLCIAIFTQDVISGIIVLVCYPFIIAFMRLIGYTASDESAKRHDGFVEMSNHFMDSLRGMDTLRTFGMSQGYARSVYVTSERYRRMVMKTLRIAQLSGAVLDVFATCGLAAVAIMLGFRMVEGSVAFLPALATLMLVPEYFMPIKAYASDYHASLDGKSALAKLARLASCERDRVSLPNDAICVQEGETVALTGKSGSGKTTFLDVMAGASDIESGDVSICGTCGTQLVDDDWRRRVAYIPQHPYVLSGTVRENVALYEPSASDDEVREALSKVGLRVLVDEMPEGLDAPLGAKGRSISGGEARRLAASRAIVGGRDVWLLDEPGSSLDDDTDSELMEAMLPLMDGRTVVIATHEGRWAEAADRTIDVGAMEGIAHV